MSAKKNKKTPTSAAAKRRSSRANPRGKANVEKEPLIYNRKHYLLLAAGFGIMIVGMLLMSGGGPENYNDWDADRIYSFRRTVLAPIVILGGLVFEIYVIFKK